MYLNQSKPPAKLLCTYSTLYVVQCTYRKSLISMVDASRKNFAVTKITLIMYALKIPNEFALKAAIE